METEKYNEATVNRPTGDRPIDASQLSVNLEKEIKRLKKEKAWRKGDKNSRTLFKSGNVTTVLVALRRNAEIQTQKPEDMLMLQVIDGRINFKSEVRSEVLEEGQVLFFHEGIDYNIRAKRRSLLLLTVVGKEKLNERPSVN